MGTTDFQFTNIFISFICILLALSCKAEDPNPKPWPEQFHALTYQIRPSGQQPMLDLWYDRPNQRNLNIVQYQLGKKVYDVEWGNGTSFYFDLQAKSCFTLHFEVGILRPEWLDHAHYLGVEQLDGFTCNVWGKADFIRYYEDSETKIPVAWLFTESGMFIHVMTFEEGAVLPDKFWQAPSSCFTDAAETQSVLGTSLSIYAATERQTLREVWNRW